MSCGLWDGFGVELEVPRPPSQLGSSWGCVGGFWVGSLSTWRCHDLQVDLGVAGDEFGWFAIDLEVPRPPSQLGNSWG